MRDFYTVEKVWKDPVFYKNGSFLGYDRSVVNELNSLSGRVEQLEQNARKCEVCGEILQLQCGSCDSSRVSISAEDFYLFLKLKSEAGIGI